MKMFTADHKKPASKGYTVGTGCRTGNGIVPFFMLDARDKEVSALESHLKGMVIKYLFSS